jgi:WD40 repeat protein
VDEHGEKKLLSVMPDENPYHIHALLGHTDAIRALACYGRYCVSGSYDTTVRLWDLVKGKCLHTLVGHEQKGKLLPLDTCDELIPSIQHRVRPISTSMRFRIHG